MTIRTVREQCLAGRRRGGTPAHVEIHMQTRVAWRAAPQSARVRVFATCVERFGCASATSRAYPLSARTPPGVAVLPVFSADEASYHNRRSRRRFALAQALHSWVDLFGWPEIDDERRGRRARCRGMRRWPRYFVQRALAIVAVPFMTAGGLHFSRICQRCGFHGYNPRSSPTNLLAIRFGRED